MSTITAILEADVDGTLHLPLPTELQGRKVRITADLQSVAELTPEEESMRRDRVQAALQRLRDRGTFDNFDAVAWQREIRVDRPLPGRDE